MNKNFMNDLESYFYSNPKFNSRIPMYNDSSDYTTNAPSYYDDLARKNKLMKVLALRIWEYEEEMIRRLEQWDKNLEDFPEDVKKLLEKWLEDGTLDHIINDTIFGWKADKTYVDDELNKKITKETLFVNVNNFGAKGDGVTDDTNSFKQALNKIKGIGGKLFIPYGLYMITSEIIVPDNVVIDGYGAVLIRKGIGNTLTLNNNNTVKGLTLKHSGGFDTGDKSINIEGVLNNYIKDINIIDVKIDSVLGYGIYLKYVKGARINNCVFDNIGYAGVMGLAVTDVHVLGGHIKSIVGDDRHHGYGVSFTRDGTNSNLIMSPKSTHCSVKNMTIENVVKWEALDTHGGDNIHFIGNNIKNCRMGIAIVGSHFQGVEDHSPNFCIVENNTLEGFGDGAGIIVAGKTGDGALSNIITGNTVYNYGVEGNNIQGAIRLVDTVGTTVTDNTIVNPYEIGINLRSNNEGVKITNNTVIDPHSKDWSGVSGIALTTGGNSGLIGHNILIIKNKEINNIVGMRGIANFVVDNDVTLNENIVSKDFNFETFGQFKSFRNEVEPLFQGEIIEKIYDGYNGIGFIYKSGFTIFWKRVTVDTTIYDPQFFDFPDSFFTNGNMNVNISLVNTPTHPNINDYANMIVSGNTEGVTIRMKELGTLTDVQVSIMGIGYTVLGEM